MLRTLTVLATILFTATLNAANVPVPVPQTIQNAYTVSDMRHGHYAPIRDAYWVVDNGLLYTMNTDLHARPRGPIVHNVVKNGTLLPYRARIADHFFGPEKGKKLRQGENLFYLTNIAVDKDALVFTFASWKLYPYFDPAGAISLYDLNSRMQVRFLMTPAQIAALTPQTVKQMTDPFFTPSSTSVDPPFVIPAEPAYKKHH